MLAIDDLPQFIENLHNSRGKAKGVGPTPFKNGFSILSDPRAVSPSSRSPPAARKACDIVSETQQYRQE